MIDSESAEIGRCATLVNLIRARLTGRPGTVRISARQVRLRELPD